VWRCLVNVIKSQRYKDKFTYPHLVLQVNANNASQNRINWKNTSLYKHYQHAYPHQAAMAAILWGYWTHFLVVGVQMCTDPHFLMPCCYTWPTIHSITVLPLPFPHGGRSLSQCVSEHRIRLFDCINWIKMFGAVERDLSRPTRSPREGRK